MTSCTTDRQAQEDGTGGVDAVDHCVDPELLVVGSTLLVDQRVAVKAGGDQLVQAALWDQVSGELFGRKAIEGHVGVDGIDDPVTVFPYRTGSIDRETIGVGVAGQVEPVPSPAFPVAGRGE